MTHKCKILNVINVLLFSLLFSFSSFFAIAGTLDVNTIFGNINGNINIPVSDMSNDCTTATEKQIKMEITASLNYLNMAAFFSKDTINRPGFAKFFFDAASEEREHAYKLIEYLSMRNRYEKTAYLNTIGIKKLVADLGKITETRTVLKDADGVDVKLDGLVAQEATPGQKAEAGREATVAIDGKTTGLIALKNALKLENAVTKNIRGLIVTCERGVNDYHVSLIDFFLVVIILIDVLLVCRLPHW